MARNNIKQKIMGQCRPKLKAIKEDSIELKVILFKFLDSLLVLVRQGPPHSNLIHRHDQEEETLGLP